MKPNNLGGMTYEGAEIPAVIAAASHQDPEFAGWLTEAASSELENQQMTAAGVDILNFGEWFNFKLMDKSKLGVVPELTLGAIETNMTYGNVAESYFAGLYPHQQRPIARRILIEAGLIEEPTKLERATRLVNRIKNIRRS
jgi:hypothetical protein